MSDRASLAERFGQAKIVLDLVADNQLAVLKISDRQIVSRTLAQSIRNCAFESRVSPLQIGNGCLRHGSLPYSRIYVEKNAKKAKTPLMWIKGMGVKPRERRERFGLVKEVAFPKRRSACLPYSARMRKKSCAKSRRAQAVAP
jgi:hypothetical protein